VNPRCKLGEIPYVDSNFIGDDSPACVELRRLDADGWIWIHRTDTLDTELDLDDVEERREGLKEESSRHPESQGVAVFGASRIDHATVGGDGSPAVIDEVFGVVFPNKNRRDAGINNDFRDVMHLATAIQYGGPRFVTRDKAILKKRAELEKAYDIQVLTPEEELAFVERLKDRHDKGSSASETG
jgi:hypothetical protein